MGNGGGDCCLQCAHNVAGQRLGRYPMGLFTRRRAKDKWLALSECSLRDVRIERPFGTYCANFRYLGTDATSDGIEGPIYAAGFTEERCTYPRIPWHGDHEVFQVSQEMLNADVRCFVCDREAGAWLLVVDDGSAHVFCCNAHYMKWWREAHAGESLHYSYDELEDPGENQG